MESFSSKTPAYEIYGCSRNRNSIWLYADVTLVFSTWSERIWGIILKWILKKYKYDMQHACRRGTDQTSAPLDFWEKIKMKKGIYKVLAVKKNIRNLYIFLSFVFDFIFFPKKSLKGETHGSPHCWHIRSAANY
jgi:hypothetical protein